MKKIFRLKSIQRIAGIIALAAVIGFSMTACDEEDDSPKSQKSQSDYYIEAIAYGDGKFVAFGGSIELETFTCKVATSIDGITWTAVTHSLYEGFYEDISTIAYGNSKFVAVVYSHNPNKPNKIILTSTDGVTWTAVTPIVFGCDESKIYKIIYGNGKFVAVVAGTDNNRIATSTDGITWTAVDVSSIFGRDINSISYCKDKFFASSGGKIATSTDGVTWTEVSNITFGSNEDEHAYINEIVYGNGKFFAIGYRYNNVTTAQMATSTDGITWTTVTQSIFGDGDYFEEIVYGNGKFVARSSNKRSDDKIATSTDGVTWTDVTQSVCGDYNFINTIIYDGGKFVAGGGGIATSTDGIKWTKSVINNK